MIPLHHAQMLKDHEGVRRFPYVDTTGNLTIGVGRNLSAKPLSEKAIAFLLTEDYEEALDHLFVNLPWFAGLDEARQMVLIDMCFNLGIQGLLRFVNTLKAIEEGRWHDASIQMLASRWAKQVGDRAVDLAKIMATGILPEKWREYA